MFAPILLRCLALWLTLPCCLGAIGCGSQPAQPATSTSATEPGKAAGSSASREPEKPRPIQVKLETSAGAIIVELDAERAPLTVDNFLAYVSEGEYDGTVFHQVNKFTVLAGGYTPELAARPAKTPIYNEAANGLKNVRGTIAMARRPDAIDSATNIFFFNVADNHELLDHQERTPEGYGYCVFGRVIEGLDVVEKISQQQVRKVTTDGGEELEEVPVETVMLKTAKRVQ